MASRLREFDSVLMDLCRVSLLAPDEGPAAPACAQLIRDVITQGREGFVERHTQTPGPNEYRLNGAGLKLRYEVESYRDGDDTHVYVVNLSIGGEQAPDYPTFVRAAQSILQGTDGKASGCGVVRVAA